MDAKQNDNSITKGSLEGEDGQRDTSNSRLLQIQLKSNIFFSRSRSLVLLIIVFLMLNDFIYFSDD